MKIERFKKRHNGLYTIYLDNFNSYDFYEEIILKYELLIRKVIEDEELDKIIKDNKNYESYYEALKVLKRALKTKEEIRNILVEKKYNKDSIDFAITILEKQGYLNDKTYADSYINSSIATTLKGPKKIALELTKKGITKEIIDDALSIYSEQIEKEKIEKVISKKIKTNHSKSAKILKQKLQSDLLNSGFEQNAIMSVLNTVNFVNDGEIAKKEYQKYYKKLSKKYTGKELDYKLKQKMYSLGFTDYNDFN